MPTVNGPRDPFDLAGVPRSPHVPTPADIVNNRGYVHPRENPGAIPSRNLVDTSHISPQELQNAKVVLSKFDPKPSFLTSSRLRWILYGVLLLCGGAFRAMFRERRNNT
jgi:hypothetical protein